MPSVKKPRRGSLQFYPKKRTKRIYPKVSHWASSDKAQPLGFVGWKAGMTHIIFTDGKNSFSRAVTVLDSPPLLVCGVRYYKKMYEGLKSIGEKWMNKLPKHVKKKTGNKGSSAPEDFDDVRLLVATIPERSGMRHKKPEVLEIGIGGKVPEKKEYAESVLGKEISCKDVFQEGEFIDVASVTKGYGFTGPVKRFGITIQTRKNEQHHRHVGGHGPKNPGRIDWRVPAAGQYGFFKRTETGKQVVRFGDKPEDINPKGGFVNYGLLKSNYILVEGSVPAPKKRLVVVKKGSRKNNVKPIDVKHISKNSQQGD